MLKYLLPRTKIEKLELKKIEMIGKKFGRLMVLELKSTKSPYYWLCKCDCGVEKLVSETNLKYGNSLSCGCLAKELIHKRFFKYDTKNNSTYNSWRGMLERCNYPKHISYERYGGRGIKVCDSWYNFDNFLKDMGTKPKGYQLDRINNSGNYEPSNCRWANLIDQGRNKRNNSFLVYNGETKTIAEWSRICNISPDLIQSRIKSGWDVEDVLGRIKMQHDKNEKQKIQQVLIERYPSTLTSREIIAIFQNGHLNFEAAERSIQGKLHSLIKENKVKKLAFNTYQGVING